MLVNELIKKLEEIQDSLDKEDFASREYCFLSGKRQALMEVYYLITGRKFLQDYTLDAFTNKHKPIQ